MCYINFGEDYGKVVVIVDIADQQRVLIDGEDFPRALYPIKRLTLTRLKLDIHRGARTGTLIKAIEAEELPKKWAETPVAKKAAMR